MGHWKLWIATFTVIDTIWCESIAGLHPNWTSSGHLRRCSMADTTVDCDIHSVRYDMVREYCRPPSQLDLIRSPTTLQHGRYADKELVQWHISFYTIEANQKAPLKAVDCDIHSVRYDMVREYCRPPSQLDLIRSPTTLQHGRYADKELEQWHASFYTIVTNVNGSLEAVDCDIHSVRYDMVREYCRPPSQLDLIRSPTTLQHGRYADKELEQWHISFYTIVTNVNGSLEAVDCDIYSVRYDMVLEYYMPPSEL
eukprot:scaffold9757_cov136-Skeletonema_marinoi.AAC.1